MDACEFPTGKALDLRVLWTIAQLANIADGVWSGDIVFYAVREYGLEWASEEPYYAKLVDRSVERLKVAGLIEFDDIAGFRLVKAK